MYVEVFLCLVVDVDLDLRDFVFCFSYDDEIIGRVDFQLLAFVVVFLEGLSVNEGMKKQDGVDTRVLG